MYEYQILVRLKKTCIKNKGHIQYGNCQVCSEKYSQRCIEASQNIKGKKNTVFIFCNDCYSVVNDICCRFVYNKNIYDYETSYHINDRPIVTHNMVRPSNIYYKVPFIIGARLIMN